MEDSNAIMADDIVRFYGHWAITSVKRIGGSWREMLAETLPQYIVVWCTSEGTSCYGTNSLLVVSQRTGTVTCMWLSHCWCI
jgi:hypothetical protein